MKNFTEVEKEILNKQLEGYLSPIRFRESSSIQDSTDGRTAFHSDFSRVALSAPVRRLQDKTQVYPQSEFDFVRNRLTHSLEVLCIARGLGLGVEKILKENGLYIIGEKPEYHHAITSILETASLVHDLGNPPFGHQIEYAIQNYFKHIPNTFIQNQFDKLDKACQEDFYNIEGNVQGFRILRHLALAKDEFSYNLTMPTMATIIKYPYSSLEGNKGKGEGVPHELEKFGYLQSEAKDYLRICDTLGLRTKGQRHPLTYLLEAADDIAYLVCDIEDAYKNGNVSLNEIVESYTKIQKKGFQDNVINECINSLLCKDEVTEQVNLQTLRIQLQSKMIIECTKTYCENYDSIMTGNYKQELIKNSKVALLEDFCKDIITPVYKAPEILEKTQKATLAVNYILTGFLNAVLLLNVDTPKDAPEYLLYQKISSNYRKVSCEDHYKVPTDLYKKFLLVTDYIFGMTDGFLMKIYEEDSDIHELILRVQCKIDNL